MISGVTTTATKVDRLLARRESAEAAEEAARHRARVRTLAALEALVEEVGYAGAGELTGMTKQAVHDRVLRLRRLTG
jgi:hypothetical protein